jgi:hypothetical protein
MGASVKTVRGATMVGHRGVVCGFVILCSVLVGCGGAPFTAGGLVEADTSADDASSTDPAIGDAGSSTPVPANDDAGSLPAPSSGDAGAAAPDSGASLVPVEADADAGAVARDGSPPSDGGTASDAGPCGDGGSLYLHHVGLDGLTWQDCVPTGTYDATQALEACATYAVATNAVAFSNGLPLCSLQDDPGTESCASSAILNVVPAVGWTYIGVGQDTATGHVAMFGTHSDGSCTTPQDPSWD